MNLIALAVVIWLVAMSVAFGFYIPVLRAERRILARGPQWTPEPVGDDLDHAASSMTAFAAEGAAPPVPAQVPAKAVTAQVIPLDPAPLSVAAMRPAEPDAFSVLIVDDNAINRQVLELILDSVGMAHASVENGLEAVRAMEGCAYDAVLMDLQMPVMDGFEATRRIRALEAARGGRSTIIVVSANYLDEDVDAGRSAGADAHLPKPISAATLVQQLAACPAANRMAA
ncbi:response regulator [Phenylobacterium sp.]|uniref:response regulator n=1 Tax=Phenylobacterium sp. TaxID=1871053 RepID=UPI0025ED2014|nr:response regulator [Phenylobacterium sp.]